MKAHGAIFFSPRIHRGGGADSTPSLVLLGLSPLELLFNPNPIGGGAFMAPPCHFFRRASRPIGISRSNFMTFFSEVSRIF